MNDTVGLLNKKLFYNRFILSNVFSFKKNDNFVLFLKTITQK